MRRLLFPLALLLPALAHAQGACDIVRDGEGLHIVVGSTASGCFSDPAFRAAFVARLNRALAEEEAAREARVRALTAARAGRSGTATVGGRYYGQQH